MENTRCRLAPQLLSVPEHILQVHFIEAGSALSLPFELIDQISKMTTNSSYGTGWWITGASVQVLEHQTERNREGEEAVNDVPRRQIWGGL